MTWAKRYWFPAAVVILTAIIGCNLYTIFSSKGNEYQERVNPRVLTLAVSAKDENASLDAETLRQALESFGPVNKAQLQIQEEPGPQQGLELTVAEPVKLSELQERLDWQDSVLVEEGSTLEGELRIQISGTSEAATAKALREQLGDLEGLEVVKVNLAGDDQGVTLRSAGTVSISNLRQAVNKAQFGLEDIEWPVESGAGKAAHIEGSSSKHEGSASK